MTEWLIAFALICQTTGGIGRISLIRQKQCVAELITCHYNIHMELHRPPTMGQFSPCLVKPKPKDKT